MCVFREALLVAILISGITCGSLKNSQENHKFKISTNEDYRTLLSLQEPKYINKVLNNILIPRVVGTENHTKVRDFITGELQKLKWHVEIDEFEDQTPNQGKLKFRNIIASLNPEAERFLVLACHYDSKYFPKAYFVGAIDSAVPCAMMLDIAKTLKTQLQSLKDADLSLRLIFFDGEEAFKVWGPRDSIYGARHLAGKMARNRRRTKSDGEMVNDLQRIDLMILLDLIGHRDAMFLSYFPETDRFFQRMYSIASALYRGGSLSNPFRQSRPGGNIEDDHIPFLARGVPILHLISYPFPPEWHTPSDNRDLVDMDTVHKLNLVLKAFITEYFSLLV